MKRLSLRARLLAGTAIGVGLAFVVSGVLVEVLTRSSLYEQFDESLSREAQTLAALVEQDGSALDTEDLRQVSPRDEYFEVWDTTGTPVLRSPSLGRGELAHAAAGELAIAPVTLPSGRPGRQATLRFLPRPDEEHRAPTTIKAAIFAIARPTDALENTVGRLGSVLLAVGVAAMIFTIVLLAWIARFGLAPIRALAKTIATAELSSRLDPTTVPVELRPVVERLDDLLRRLDTAFTRERELTAEVAHELRTPLAGLRVQLEVALDRDRSPERYRTTLASCLAICIETQRSVDALLALARLDAGAVALECEVVDVAAVVLDGLAPLADAARARELTIVTELAATTVTTDRAKLEIVIRNLLDNALSYANQGGDLRVELTGAPKGARISVRISNSGCELTPDQVTQVFERFWRADPARTVGHAGIGLALCKKLVECLGGTIAARVAGGRFVATVTLPTA